MTSFLRVHQRFRLLVILSVTQELPRKMMVRGANHITGFYVTYLLLFTSKDLYAFLRLT